MIKCRQELRHEGDNEFYVEKVTFTGSEILLCCLELQGLHRLHSSSRSGELKEPYITGYMYIIPYTNSKWENWLKKFTLQSGCEYRKCSQEGSNAQSRETGVIQVESKVYTYSSAWSYAYSCLRGGVGQFKPLCLGKRNRSSIGTRSFGCTTVVHIRLLDVSNGMKILEYKFLQLVLTFQHTIPPWSLTSSS